jgi:hypothetical protein
MKTKVMMAVLVSMSMASTNVLAHEDHDDEEKAIPKTCAQLADTKHYTNDVAYPEVKALKARCDAEKKDKPATAKPGATPAAGQPEKK